MSDRPPYPKGSPLAAEAGRKGGKVGGGSNRKKSPPPYAGTIIDLMDDVGLVGDDWRSWRVLLKAAFALPMSPDELIIFRALTGWETPPSKPVLELWLCCGRRAGKSTIAALVAFYKGITADPRSFAKEEELVIVPILASDRKQSRNLLGHLKSFARTPTLMKYVEQSDLNEKIKLANGIEIEISTASSTGVRGYTSVACVADEVAFWGGEESSDPADEILDALRPTMGTVPGSLLLALSNPYAPRGPLFEAVDKYYGQPNDEVLVVVADTRSLHPSFSAAVIKRAYAKDPVKASAEYGSDGTIQFRQHQQALFDQEPVDALIVTGRRELPPDTTHRYVAFLDAAQGSRSGDSMTLAIAHADEGRGVLDCVIERRPPFNPLDVLTTLFAPALQRYGISTVVGDQVSKGFVEAALAVNGIRFQLATWDKSRIYLQLLNLVNSRAVELLDVSVLRLQLLALQRYAMSGGKDRIDHPKGRQAHDDVANACAGALTLVSGEGAKLKKKVRIASDRLSNGRTQSIHQQLGALARATVAGLEREEEYTARLNKKYEHEPMISQPVWRVHK